MTRHVRRWTVAFLLAGLTLATLPASTLAAVAQQVLFAPAASEGPTTFLLLGSDAGPPPRSSEPRRSNADAFHLLTISADHQRAAFVNIPRDAWVPVPGQGTTRINACLYAGPDSCVATVESVFGVAVDHYLLTSMEAFKQAVADFGGLTVDVERRLFDGGADITETGRQHLSGSQTLTFARDRKNRPDGDFGRSAAQAEVLATAHSTLRSQASVGRVVEAAALLRRYTFTDIPPSQLLRYGFTALTLRPKNVTSVTLPGSVGFAGPAAVVFLDDAAYALVRDATDDGRV